MDQFIYTLTDPSTNEVFYVGKTTDPERRLRRHRNDALRSQRLPVFRQVREVMNVGCEPVLKVIESVNDEDWEERERYWIQHFLDRGLELANILPGGFGRGLRTGMWSHEHEACIECGTTEREHVAKGLCGNCYARLRHQRVKQPDRPYFEWSWDYESCTECGTTERPHKGQGLCTNCFARYKRSLKPAKPKRWTRLHDHCQECGGTDRPHGAHGLCKLCYERKLNGTTKPLRWSRKHPRCQECGTTERKHQARGLCTPCYNQWYQRNN